MGATWPFIKRIFILEGALINIIGAAVGTVLGLSLCLAQQKFGLLRLHGTVVDFYPIKIDGVDITVVISTVVFIGVIATYFMVNYLIFRIYIVDIWLKHCRYLHDCPGACHMATLAAQQNLKGSCCMETGHATMQGLLPT